MGKLAPEGTRLCDLPPNWRGISWEEYKQNCMRLILTAPAPEEEDKPEPEINRKPISTQLDNYGWRSLPTGTRYLGGGKSR